MKIWHEMSSIFIRLNNIATDAGIDLILYVQLDMVLQVFESTCRTSKGLSQMLFMFSFAFEMVGVLIF